MILSRALGIREGHVLNWLELRLVSALARCSEAMPRWICCFANRSSHCKVTSVKGLSRKERWLCSNFSLACKDWHENLRKLCQWYEFLNSLPLSIFCMLTIILHYCQYRVVLRPHETRLKKKCNFSILLLFATNRWSPACNSSNLFSVKLLINPSKCFKLSVIYRLVLIAPLFPYTILLQYLISFPKGLQPLEASVSACRLWR